MRRGRSIQNEYNEYLQIEFQNGIEEPLSFDEWLESEVEDV